MNADDRSWGAHIQFLDDSEPDLLASDLRHRNPGTVVALLRGWKCPSVERFFDEIGAALQLPGYFGENWNALDECIGDLSWLPATGYTIIVSDIGRVLPRDDQSLALLLSVLHDAAVAWTSRGTPFDVLVCGDAQGLLRARSVAPK